MGAAAADHLATQALRLHDRYLNEVVLAYGLCPWAERVVRQGTFRRAVVSAHQPAPSALSPFIDRWLAEAPPVDIAFVIFPRLALDSPAFDGFTERLRRAERARRPLTESSPFLLAAFHPFGASEFRDANQLVAFVRRCPDPTVQLVRASLMEQVRAAGVDVSESVARQNFATVSTRGVEALGAILEDLRCDRDRTYRQIGELG
ncbi:MAG: hypothetical protein QOI66_2829 [Myxococcales bacterium]|nr:hypothetical protein [Myxococcales bacterium]